MGKYIVYTDGSSNGKKGVGGCAAIILQQYKPTVLITQFINKEIGNNYAELSGVYIAIKYIPAQSNITLHTDSQNVIGWLQDNWKRNKEDIDFIVQRTLNLQEKKKIQIEYQWVKAHADNRYNEMCDKAAKEAKCSGLSRIEEIVL
jgi:ribonuclease HI